LKIRRTCIGRAVRAPDSASPPGEPNCP